MNWAVALMIFAALTLSAVSMIHTWYVSQTIMTEARARHLVFILRPINRMSRMPRETEEEYKERMR